MTGKGGKFFLPGEGLGLFPREWETLVGALIIHGLGEVPVGRTAYRGRQIRILHEAGGYFRLMVYFPLGRLYC